MLILYVKTKCPYCEKVLIKGKELGVAFDERNIADEQHAKDLVEKGGKRQVPYLVDEEKNISMYESDDIVKYLEESYNH